MSKEKRKKYYLIIIFIVIIISIIGSTYAYFSLSASDNNTISGTAGIAGLSLNVSKVTPETTGTNYLIPQLESTLGAAISDANKCIDGNSNIVCQVYQITPTNIGTTNVKIQGKIEFTNISNLPNLKWKLITDKTNIGTNPSITASTTPTNIGDSIKLIPNQSTNLYIVIWIDETNDIQNDTGTFSATITFGDSNGKGVTSTFMSN